jgi:HTH-type transcriptional regulator/antitoxin HipB
MSNNKAVMVSDIGVAIRKKRKDDGLTLADAAALCGVGYRFMSDLENGKSTVQLGKVLQVLNALGVDIYTVSRKWPNE